MRRQVYKVLLGAGIFLVLFSVSFDGILMEIVPTFLNSTRTSTRSIVVGGRGGGDNNLYFSNNLASDANTSISASDEFQVRHSRTVPRLRRPVQKNDAANSTGIVAHNRIRVVHNNDNNSSIIPPATIVVELSGEMGNHLSKLAHGFGLSLWLQREYGVQTKIVLRHQEKPKWLTARDALQQCFPVSRTWDFQQGNTAEIDLQRVRQTEWLGTWLDGINGVKGFEEAQVDSTLQLFATLLANNHSRAEGPSSNVSSPFLYSQSFVTNDIFMDRYYDEYRRIFQFDTACCKILPEPDESVFVSKVLISKGDFGVYIHVHCIACVTCSNL
jgi:hypothetical protein